MPRDKTVVEVLEDALAIVSHDGWWTQGELCTREDGVCALGAIAVADGAIQPSRMFGKLEFDVTPTSTKIERPYEDLTKAGRRAIRYLYAAVKGRPRPLDLSNAQEGVIEWNDDGVRTQAGVIRGFEKALYSARRDGA